MVTSMKLKPFCQKYGVPMTLMREALRGEYRNQIGRKVHPEKEKSDWLIYVEPTLKLFKERAI